MKIVVVDYGQGNLFSIKRVLDNFNISNNIESSPLNVSQFDKMIIPGVGSFATSMKTLQENGWVDEIKNFSMNNKPILGICLGMQLLASAGSEHGDSLGLNLIEGKVIKLEPSFKEKIPHVGWNQIDIKKNSILLNNIDSGKDFYFVHSYHFEPNNDQNIIATTTYSKTFCSVVESNNIFGTQFHPEKSSKEGIKILNNFINL